MSPHFNGGNHAQPKPPVCHPPNATPAATYFNFCHGAPDFVWLTFFFQFLFTTAQRVANQQRIRMVRQPGGIEYAGGTVVPNLIAANITFVVVCLWESHPQLSLVADFEEQSGQLAHYEGTFKQAANSRRVYQPWTTVDHGANPSFQPNLFRFSIAPYP